MAEKHKQPSKMARRLQGIPRYFSTLMTLYYKELKGFIGTPYGWVLMACTLLLQGFCMQTAMQVMSKATGDGIMFHIFNNINFWFYFIFIFPLLTMRSFAEEERLGTLEGLLTAPVTTGQIVLGKYLAIYTFYIILWLPLLVYPYMADMANTYTQARYNIDPGQTLVYNLTEKLGPISILALTGAFFVAVGLFCSAMSRSQIIAGILSTSFMCLFYFLGRITELWGEFPAAPAFHYISCYEHVLSFARGLLDTRPLVLYCSSAVLMLVLTCKLVDYRRWRR